MGVNGGYLYPPTIARFGGKKKSFYIGSNAIYFIQGKSLDGSSCLDSVHGIDPAF